MKTYFGKRNYAGDAIVIVSDLRDGTTYERRLRHIARHSPTGFEWAYSGSGPADLAYSLLVDHFGGDAIAARRAKAIYQAFKHRVIAHLPYTGWHFDAVYIDEMLRDIETAMRAHDNEPHGAVVESLV